MHDYKLFYDYFMGLYGDGLEVTGYHLDGHPEPLDDLIDSAVATMQKLEVMNNAKG